MLALQAGVGIAFAARGAIVFLLVDAFFALHDHLSPNPTTGLLAMNSLLLAVGCWLELEIDLMQLVSISILPHLN